MSEPMNAFERCSAALIDLSDAASPLALTPYDAAATSAHLHNVMRDLVDRAERACSEVLPPVKVVDLARAQDPTLEREVVAYRDAQYSAVDISDLDDSDGDAWEVSGGSTRYEVRKVPRYSAVPSDTIGNPYWIVRDNTDGSEADTFDAVDALEYFAANAVGFNEAEARAIAAWLNDNAPGSADPLYVVVDTDTRGDPPDYSPEGNDYNPEDEDDAREVAERANDEDYRNNANGWPFCQNYAYIIDAREADDFRAAGFVVACYKGDTYYAGIDGGGYSFTDAHWLPLYLARAAGKYGWPVRTSAGLRRVTT